MYGYSGKILHIDLKERTHWAEDKPEDWYKLYIGGVAMATRLCWENIEVGCDAYDPGNPVCFANGIFAGTPVPVGGKYGLASKSPLTGFIGDSLSGSWLCIAMKRAQWDGVVIHNASDKWVHVFIDDDRVEFLPADHLLGLGTYETEEAIREDSAMTRFVLRPSAQPVRTWFASGMSPMTDARQAAQAMALSGAARNSRQFPSAVPMVSLLPTRKHCSRCLLTSPNRPRGKIRKNTAFTVHPPICST